MLAFVLSALCFSILFAILLSMEPVGRDRLSLFSLRLRRRIRRYLMVRHLTMAALILLPFGLLFVIAGVADPSYVPHRSAAAFVLSPYFTSSALGAVFAAVLVVWLFKLYSLRRREKAPLLLNIELVFLILLFVLGSWDALQPIFTRVSGVKVAGAEISFNPSEHRQSSEDPRTTARSPFSEASASSFSLSNLAEMPSIIDRDLRYGVLLKSPTPIPKADQFRAFVNGTYSALAACQNRIYTQTGDRKPLQRHVDALLRATRIHQADADAASDVLADALSDAAVEVLGAAIDYKAMGYGGDAAATAGAATDEEVAEPPSADCITLVVVPCAWRQGTATSAATDAFCAQRCPNTARTEDVTTQTCGKVLPALTLHDRSLFRDLYRAAVVEKLRQAAGEKAAQAELPYWTIVYAQLAALNGEADAADEALARYMKKPGCRACANEWLQVRVLSTLVYITDETARQNQFTPTVIKTYLIDNYKNLIDSYQALALEPGLHRLFLKDPEKTTRMLPDLHPVDANACAPPDVAGADPREARREFQLRIATGYSEFTAMMNFVDEALDDTDYQNLYAASVANYLEALNAIDFSCLRRTGLAPVWQTISNVNHAEILRLNAKRALVEAPATLYARGPGRLKDVLGEAKAQTTAARQLLASYRSAATEESRKQSFLLSRIIGSNAGMISAIVDTYENVAQTHQAVVTRMDADK